MRRSSSTGDAGKRWMASPHNPMFDEQGRGQRLDARQIRPDLDTLSEMDRGERHWHAELNDAAKNRRPGAISFAGRRVSSMQLGYFDTEDAISL